MFKELKLTVTLVVLTVSGAAFADVIDGEELRDPTRPLFVRVTETGDGEILEMIRNVIPASYDLSFIRASSTSPMAVINSARVTIGDVIGGAEVIAIERSSVTLSIDGEEQRITLYDETIKSPAVP